MQDRTEQTEQQAARLAAAPIKPLSASSLSLTINDKVYVSDADPDMPLLWYLRDVLRLTGTKFGCGIGACGACTVLMDGKAIRTCMTPLKTAAGKQVITIEGLQRYRLHPVQQAWIDEDVVQCGYCQSGQIMAAVDLLSRNARPGDDDIAKIGNICRCGTYPRIRKAVLRAAETLRGEKS